MTERPPIVIPDGFTRKELLAECDRELHMRDRVYPGLVARGKITGSAASTAVARLRAIRNIIAQLPGDAESQAQLFAPEPRRGR